jgi:hypothetical protein
MRCDDDAVNPIPNERPLRAICDMQRVHRVECVPFAEQAIAALRNHAGVAWKRSHVTRCAQRAKRTLMPFPPGTQFVAGNAICRPAVKASTIGTLRFPVIRSMAQNGSADRSRMRSTCGCLTRRPGSVGRLQDLEQILSRGPAGVDPQQSLDGE